MNTPLFRVERIASHASSVGGLPITRALPTASRRISLYWQAMQSVLRGGR